MNYYQRYRRKLMRGEPLSPRGKFTNVSYNETFSFTPGQVWRRKYDNPAIGIIEGLQFIAGIEDREAIHAAAPKVDLSLFGPTSFYGSRTVGQFEQAIEELKHDPHSRRAVVHVAHHDDSPETIPCTQLMHFYIPHNSYTLMCTIHMRSSDAVWGMPYDMIQFGMVHTAVSNCLDLIPGPVTVFMTNAHIYADHDGGPHWWEASFIMPKMSTWKEYKQWAQSIVERRLSRSELENLLMLTDK